MDHCNTYRADVRAMRDVLERERCAGGPLPTVYCNLGHLDYVWLDLHAQSYFDWWQAGGFMFRRDMAVEGQRRACMAGPFELERYRKREKQLTAGDKEVAARFFHTDFERGPLREADLARLCAEPGLDYVLLEQRFEGLHLAQSGRLYLYRCSQVRTALGLPDPLAATRLIASCPDVPRPLAGFRH
jgi:hypothetical protein